MDLDFTVAAQIANPVAEVFETVAGPAQLFTTGGAQSGNNLRDGMFR